MTPREEYFPDDCEPLNAEENAQLDAIFNRYYEPVYWFWYRRTSNNATEAEDAANDAFSDLWKEFAKTRRWPPEAELMKFLRGRARTRGIDRSRKQMRQWEIEEEAAARKDYEVASPLERVLTNEQMARVLAVVAMMPPDRGEVFTLIQLQGWDVGTVAFNRNTTPRAVRKLLDAGWGQLMAITGGGKKALKKDLKNAWPKGAR